MFVSGYIHGPTHLRCYSCLIFCCFCSMSVSLHVTKLPHHLHVRDTVLLYWISFFLGIVDLYHFLKSAQSRVGRLTANTSLPGEQPPPRLPVTIEWLNGWLLVPHNLLIPCGSERRLWPLPVIKIRFFSYLNGRLNTNPFPQGSKLNGCLPVTPYEFSYPPYKIGSFNKRMMANEERTSC